MIRLYKFQPINKFTIRNLVEKGNWVADPRNFNDPFEFLKRADRDITESGLVYHSPEDVKFKEFLEGLHEPTGVVCYTENGIHDVLMWSHYADNHQGVCLVFEVGPDQWSNLHKVTYEKVLPKLDYTPSNDSVDENLKLIATTKSKAWEYENEWREVFNFKSEHVDYPGKLVEIVFGCRCSVQDMKVIWNLIVPHYGKDVEFSKTYMSKGSFQLSSIIHPKQFNELEKFPADLDCMK